VSAEREKDLTTSRSGRGWADLTTNAVDLGCGVDELRSLLEDGSLPAGVLPNFLHEFAHFYCLQSPVGGVIAFLFLEARHWFLSSLVASRTRARNRRRAFPPTAVRVDTSVRLLRPLLEGMALFAEHDLFPGSAAIASTLSGWIALLFLIRLDHLPTDPDPAWIDRATQEFFLNSRSIPSLEGSQSWAASKASLLLQPLALKGGGYLAGYLTVKNLWKTASQRVPALADADLFFMYFYSLIFDDYTLVEILFDDHISEAKRAKQMFNRLRERLELLNDDSLADRVADYQAAVENRKDDAIGIDGHYGSIFLDEKFVEIQRSRIQKRQQRLAAAARTEAERSLLIGHACALLHRGLMRIGLVAVDVKVTDEGQVIGQNGDQFKFVRRARNGVRPGTGSGILAVYFHSRRLSRIVLCFRDGEVVFEEFPTECLEEERAQIIYAIYKTSTLEASYADLDAELQRRTGAAVDANTWLREDFPRILDNFYENLSTRFVLPGSDVACIQAMRASGFKAMAGRSDLITALALFGLLSSCKVCYADAVTIFRAHGLDLGVCEHVLDELSVEWGMQLLSGGAAVATRFNAKAAVASTV
jgi:hypothetical protein